MLEQLTQGSLRALTLARSEALRLEFGKVLPAHLFLGIVAEHHGIGAVALRRLGIELKGARAVLEKMLGRGYMSTSLAWMTYTPEIVQVVRSALAATRHRLYPIVDTEHLLLALIRSDDPLILQLLEKLGVSISRLEQEIKKTEQAFGEHLFPQEERLSEQFSHRFLLPITVQVMAQALNLTAQHGHLTVGTEEVLLALLETPCLAQRLLLRAGLVSEHVALDIQHLIGQGHHQAEVHRDYSAVLKRSLNNAWVVASKFPAHQIGTAHLLFGILQIEESTVHYLFATQGCNPEQMRLDILYVLQKHTDEPEPTPDDLDALLAQEQFDSLAFDDEDDAIVAQLNALAE